MLREKANNKKSLRQCLDRETDSHQPRDLLFSAKSIAMFIRCLPAVVLGLMFDCIASGYKKIFLLPFKDRVQRPGSGLELRVVLISFCIFPSLPCSEDLIWAAGQAVPRAV